VIGMAARAGAKIADAEFVQFHPTAIDSGEDPAPLATEALRGEGAILINSAGERFMLAVHPDAELAPRDIVARAIFAEHQAGRRPMLDTRAAIGADVITKYLAVADGCRRAGIDPVTDPIPVAPAAHYHMGGIETDGLGLSSIGNLWVCGESSSTGLHGANRLASNGLLEAMVYGRICALGIETALPELIGAETVEFTFPDGPEIVDEAAVTELRHVMTNHVGVLRNGDGLRHALREIARIEAAATPSNAMLNMTATATLIAASALLREESRGGHFRTDFPEANPAMAARSHITLDAALAVRAAALEA
jgi:L-aspartate oxidase